MDNNKDIQLDLNFEEINVILKALGNLPFNEVYDLIGKIHEQANTQQSK
jgi:hypothetical protein